MKCYHSVYRFIMCSVSEAAKEGRRVITVYNLDQYCYKNTTILVESQAMKLAVDLTCTELAKQPI